MEWLSVNQIAKEIETPVPTVRRYIQKHQNFINSKKYGKKILVDPSCVEVLKEIRKLYVIDNMVDSEIDEALVNKGFHQYLDISITEESRPVPQGDYLEGVKEYLESMKRELMEQQQVNHLEVMAKIDEQNKRIEQRDYVLMEYIKEKREVAATTKKKKWKFWE